MRRFIPACLVAPVVALVLVGGTRPAAAQGDDDEPDSIVVLTGRAEVRQVETVDTVVIVDGPAVVSGTVRNSVVAFNGDVLVTGTVEDEVVAFRGRVTITGGRVEGDVVSRHRPVVQDGGRLDGSWERWNPSAWNWASAVVTRLAVWVTVSVSTLLLGLILGALAPRAARAVDEERRAGIGPIILWGLVVAIGLPVLGVLALATVLALPLGLGVLLALGLVYGIGYATAAWLLGRAIANRAKPIVAFLAGWAVLRVVAIVPVLGGLAWCAAVVVGLGAIVVAGYRTRTRAPQVASSPGAGTHPGQGPGPGPAPGPADAAPSPPPTPAP